MPQVEHMWPRRESPPDRIDRLIERRAARYQRERIEIALDGKPFGQLGVGPGWIDRLIEADGIDPGFACLGRQLAAGALGEADHRNARMAGVKPLHQLDGGGDHPALEFARSEAP